MAKVTALVTRTRHDALNNVGMAVFVYADARSTLLLACREAEKTGASRDDIMEMLALSYLGKALGRNGVTVSDLEGLRAIAAKPSNTTKVADDLKRSDAEQAAWDAARQGKSRAIASLGWIAKGTRGAPNKTGAPIKTNAQRMAERHVVPVDAKLALPKFAENAMALTWFGNMAKLLVQCQKQNAKFIPAAIASATSEYVAKINTALKG